MKVRVWRETHAMDGVTSWDVEPSGIVVLKNAKHDVLGLVADGTLLEFVSEATEKPVHVPIVHSAKAG
ncbi:MAG TPA: hypothetical protein VNG93_13965 [Candidatus Dormibacteraeota bacterium]|nr:hypothetical protein [Candidatus Dormibacteraeota bacterium]